MGEFKGALLVLLFLAAFFYAAYTFHATPESELADMKAKQMDCQQFKKAYEQVNPKVNTDLINIKIKQCQNIGAWE